MTVRFEVKKTFKVDGREYDSLDQVPAEVRSKVEQALAAGWHAEGKVTVNGKTYASLDDVPQPLRALVRGATSLAVRRADPTRAEPVVTLNKILFAVGAAAMLYWIARYVI
jgi:hypothetical protein